MSDAISELYTLVKGLESSFPLPTPVATIRVGTFDASTGKFEGLRTEEVVEPPDKVTRKPRRHKVTPVAEAGGVHVTLEFEVKNPRRATRVTANGFSATAPSGQRIVSIDVRDATKVHWNISSGRVSVEDDLRLKRPLIVGAGAFTVSALPIAVVYEPPPDHQLKNKASYSVSNTVGTTTRTSFSREDSRGRPGASGEFGPAADLGKAMQDTAAVLGKVAKQIPYGEAMVSALKLIADGLGKVAATQTFGETITKEGALSLVQLTGATIDTGPNNGGPGVGDVITFLRDARVVWMARDGKLSLALLESGGSHIVSARPPDILQNIPGLGLDAETASALAALDPFATGGPVVELPSDRFELRDTFDILGTGDELTMQEAYTVTSTDRQVRVNFSTRLEDRRAGWLNFLGIGGLPQTETIKTNVSLSSATEASSAQTASATLKLNCEADEYYSVEVYFDRIFGTFAVKDAPLAAEDLVSGFVLSTEGKPVEGQTVSLMSGDRIFTTWSDKQGRFAFRSRAIKPGVVSLSAGKGPLRNSVLDPGKMLKDLEVRLM